MEKAFLPISKKDMKERGMGSVRFCLCDRRCLCRSFVVWTGDHQPSLGGVWLQSGDYLAAGLERRQEYYRAWRAKTRFFGVRRKYGFHGKSLYGQ